LQSRRREAFESFWPLPDGSRFKSNRESIMADIVLISGSPSAPSRSTTILEYARQRFTAQRFDVALISVREFPPAELILAKYNDPVFNEAKALLAGAAAVVVATPVYKAAYSGTLKTFLDILPQYALRGKIVLPIVTGGSPAHMLAIDYALKPVLSALGATDLLQGVYVTDEQIKLLDFGEMELSEELRERLHAAIDLLANRVKGRLVTTTA
jgi:FMN reductase